MNKKVVEGVWDAAQSRPESKYAIMKYTREIDTLGQNKRVFWTLLDFCRWLFVFFPTLIHKMIPYKAKKATKKN